MVFVLNGKEIDKTVVTNLAVRSTSRLTISVEEETSVNISSLLNLDSFKPISSINYTIVGFVIPKR